MLKFLPANTFLIQGRIISRSYHHLPCSLPLWLFTAVKSSPLSLNDRANNLSLTAEIKKWYDNSNLVVQFLTCNLWEECLQFSTPVFFHSIQSVSLMIIWIDKRNNMQGECMYILNRQANPNLNFTETFSATNRKSCTMLCHCHWTGNRIT